MEVTSQVLVLNGDGLNCEAETQRVLESFDVSVSIVHHQEFIKHPEKLLNYQMIVFPGGFSFGDQISSGKVFAFEWRHCLSFLQEFVAQDKLILGVCNGFQILSEMNLFEQNFSLVDNSQKSFINKWVDIKVSPRAKGPWFKSLEKTNPKILVRHAEGRIFNEQAILDNQALNYLEDVNGSHDLCAGVTDRTGNILGLMPHPESGFNFDYYPFPHQDKDQLIGHQILSNACNYIRNKQ